MDSKQKFICLLKQINNLYHLQHHIEQWKICVQQEKKCNKFKALVNIQCFVKQSQCFFDVCLLTSLDFIWCHLVPLGDCKVTRTKMLGTEYVKFLVQQTKKVPSQRVPSKLFPGLPWWLTSKEFAHQCSRQGTDNSWSGKFPYAVELLTP